ncbi:uncharacterized protein Z518_09572 [Rhinocladiella mackenziei CBS 650.93]|uniref:Arylsulfotransferase n=1 Tax=Rhinocladiella mackenziei CBS 650.93 TaxID=1442369 RepID=A0A0D2IYY5_9EURO|nr:uncharacterized protein Z518_09572 [Rhinocladiella mackenziei CBS 650.93]KIX01845.1 hypothetical protein Z518_09572 [Rhinocladiella mackenziei CBS 650.93]
MRWRILGTMVALAGLILADQDPFINSQAFDDGEFGKYPTQEYKTSDIHGPRPNFLTHSGSCYNDGLYVMTTPRGYAVTSCGPMITDEKGALVWLDTRYTAPYNLAVQTYKGEQYLTFWAGDDGVRGHGAGVYFMLNSHYEEAYRIVGGNGLDGDLHEFRITDQDTVLITVYEIVQADLSSVGGPVDGWIWEGIFQELDIETNDVLFEWRASEHIGLDESFASRGDNTGISSDSAWDWFHINSVDKDPDGNYIISSRYVCSVTHINGTTGEIIWILGGKSNMFRDLSDGMVTQFASQHHARWRDDYTAITIFDNENPGPRRPSNGLYIDLDETKMTAKLRTKYKSPHPELSESQGSLQILDNGNVIVGYGYLGQYTEFTNDGKPICDVHLGPQTQYGSGNIQSYRVGKFAWVGKPNWPPAIVQEEGHIYMSWMGSTEVSQWMIEEADSVDATDDEFSYVKKVDKNGFETEITNFGSQKAFIRAVALDKDNNRLSVSAVVERGPLVEEPDPEPSPDPEPAPAGNTSPSASSESTVGMIMPILIALIISTCVATVVVISLSIRSGIKYRTYRRVGTSDSEKKDQQIQTAKKIEIDDSDTLSLVSEEQQPMMPIAEHS